MNSHAKKMFHKHSTLSAHANRTLLLTVVTLMFVAPVSAAIREKVYSFQFEPDGSQPSAGVTFGADGALYGTSLFGGGGACAEGCGTVFRIAKGTSGAITESVIHTFQGGLADGQNPTSSLVFDSAGNLYGTAEGGLHGCGIVFELSPHQNGEWSESILHSFNAFDGNNDGCIGGGNFSPTSSLTFDQSGNLFGTTPQGGGGDTDFFCFNGCGTVFRMTHQPDGSWQESVLHSFPKSGASSDGQNPQVGVLVDSSGNLYGTTYLGGPDGAGIVYQLQPENGSWKENVLFSFQGNSTGMYPNGALVLDNNGGLFGTTFAGSTCSNCAGDVYHLTPTRQGQWKETIIHAFGVNNPDDGGFPSGLLADSQGNLYGTTEFGGGKGSGCQSGCGTVYALTPGTNGTWNEHILFGFDDGTDGGLPLIDRLVMDRAGNLYGTTLFGGLTGDGVVFQLTR